MEISLLGIPGGVALYTQPGLLQSYLQRSKVNDTVDVRMLGKNLIERPLVFNIEVDEVRALATDKFYPAEDFLRGIVQVVGDDDFVASFKEGESREGAYIPSAPSRMH